MLTTLFGGARSGKSALAVALASRSDLPVTFIATAEPLDDEFAERIERHRAERPTNWATIEEPIHIEQALEAMTVTAPVIIDCLTLWVANLFESGEDAARIFDRAVRAAMLAKNHRGDVIVVSNEVGSGIVPNDALSRQYRDVLGRVNAIFAAQAHESYLVVAGKLLALSDPLELAPRHGAFG